MELGIIGLGVMGQSLALNAWEKGIQVHGFNRFDTFEDLRIRKSFEPTDICYSNDLSSFLSGFKARRIIVIMLPAGSLIDDFLKLLMPLLNSEDIVIDGGNSFYKDTQRRYNAYGNQFMGMGVSGGEKGARKGPALMLGGAYESYQVVREVLEKIGAKQGDYYTLKGSQKGESCLGYFGEGGAGHFVKMIHNGLEYTQMQLLAELIQLSSDPKKLFQYIQENGGDSFLLQTAQKVVQNKETLSKIEDKATAKGTGSWTIKTAQDLGVAMPMVESAVFARFLSHIPKLSNASDKKVANQPDPLLLEAYLTATDLNHQQAFELLKVGNAKYTWSIDLHQIIKTWSNGSIVQSAYLVERKKSKFYQGLKEVILAAVENELFIPCFQASWNYYTGVSSRYTAANAIQSMRDAFGAHGVFIDGELTKLNWE